MARPSESAARWEVPLFALACAVSLVPVWMVPYFPSQDGPAHIETAHALLRYRDAALPIYREYYELHAGLGPNTLLSWLLAGLMMLVSPAAAEKLAISGYILLFACGLRYALSGIAADNRWLALFGPLLVYNLPLHMGFYSFIYSVALFPIVIGYWIRHHPRWSLWNAMTLGALLMMLLLFHPISLVMAAVAIAAGTLSSWRLSANSGRLHATFAPLAAFIPAAVALTLFLTHSGVTGIVERARGARFRLDDFLFLRSFDSVEVWFCISLFALLGLLVAYGLVMEAQLKLRPTVAGHPHFGLLVAAGLYFVIYALAPDFMAGGGIIKMRLVLYPVLVLLLWAAARAYKPWLRALVQAAAVTLLIAQVSFYASRYSSINRSLAEYYAGIDLIQPGSTILPLCFDSWGTAPDGSPLSIRSQPFLHAAGRLAAERDALSLLNYQAAFDYFAVSYRPALNPYREITHGDENSFQRVEPIDFLTYQARTGGRVDYVLTWGLQPAMMTSPSVQVIAQQLEAGYDRIEISSEGRMQLYRRKGLAVQ